MWAAANQTPPSPIPPPNRIPTPYCNFCPTFSNSCIVITTLLVSLVSICATLVPVLLQYSPSPDSSPTQTPSLIQTPNPSTVQVLIDGSDSPLQDASLLWSDGAYSIVRNPKPDDPINPSDGVVRYVRGTKPYDSVGFQIENMPNSDDLVNRDKEFYMDIFTQAPPGAIILLQLENSRIANSSNYPEGRHSVYEGQVLSGADSEWQTIPFAFAPDRSHGLVEVQEEVDQMAVFFDHGNRLSDIFYFDNLLVAL